MMRTTNRFKLLAWLAAAPMLLAASAGYAQVSSGTSQPVTWNCTGAPCPWGSAESGNAIVWPAAANATSIRHGYTTTKAVYLSQSLANGTIIKITAGSGAAFAGTPSASSHRLLASISTGGTYTVSGLTAGEVLSVQNDFASFSYTITLPTVPPPPPPPPPPPAGTASQTVTWTCTGSPCPWGTSFPGIALVWPTSTGAVSTRLGYTTSKGIYLPKSLSNGAKIQITSGWAVVFAGTPAGAAHRTLATVSQGETYTVSGVVSGEVISVQGDYAFNYNITLPAPQPDPPPTGTDSQLVTWNCTGAPCPWGASDTGQALVWPAATQAKTIRLGYTTTKGIYLPAEQANTAVINITAGTAGVYAGRPGAESHRSLTTISAGGSFTISGLVAGEMLSVQSGSTFKYTITLPNVPPGSGPAGNDIVSKPARWVCNIPACTSAPWVSQVIDWPANSAYSTNARSGDQSRTVYSPSGQLMHPYMGRWANGCQLQVLDGTVILIEWQRGTDHWRETWLYPGESYTIHLVSPEDGAMIESYDNSPGFTVRLNSCTPQALP